MPDLAVLIPTRGRPENIQKVIAAWDFTNAWDDADMIVIADADDPEIEGYRAVAAEMEHPDTGEEIVSLVVMDEWMPMVHKLNQVAQNVAYQRRYHALGFAGDDHLPRTIGWAARYLTVLRELVTGMVYGDDGYQGVKLSTEWAVTSDVVRVLDRMVPAPVEHMYCDNAIMETFAAAGALRHLPEVTIEHMHPVVGKAETDAQYQRVNHRDQFRTDRRAYEKWVVDDKVHDVAEIRRLRRDLPDVPPPAVKPLKKERPSVSRSTFPRQFKRVVGATPHDIEITLADLAAQVPADQEIVELGVFHGRTALIMAWGASQGHGAHVTGIDPWDLEGNTYGPPFTTPEPRRWARHHVQSLGYSGRITLVQGFSALEAENWVSSGPLGEDGPAIGLLFVDADHSYDGARGDIEAWAPHLAPGATIAVDDYGHPDWPGVKQAVDALVDEGFLEPVQVFHDRLAVTKLAAVTPDAVEPGTGRVTAITSEGVTPSPEPPTVMPFGELEEPDFEPLESVDSDVSTGEAEREVLRRNADEAQFGQPGTPITDLTLPVLKRLARTRGIILGSRKDKRDDVLQALRDGA